MWLFIRQHSYLNGYPPTLREIGAHMGIRSNNGVDCHLRALERRGLVRRASGGKSRGAVAVVPATTGPESGPLGLEIAAAEGRLAGLRFRAAEMDGAVASTLCSA